MIQLLDGDLLYHTSYLEIRKIDLNKGKRGLDLLGNSVVSDKQKEHCAVNTMRRMLEKYSDENRIEFEDAFLAFASSRTYAAIFDLETGIWKEGPDYFMDLYKEELAEQLEDGKMKV